MRVVYARRTWLGFPRCVVKADQPYVYLCNGWVEYEGWNPSSLSLLPSARKPDFQLHDMGGSSCYNCCTNIVQAASLSVNQALRNLTSAVCNNPIAQILEEADLIFLVDKSHASSTSARDKLTPYAFRKPVDFNECYPSTSSRRCKMSTSMAV